MSDPTRYPVPEGVAVRGRREEPLSRWLWLVKWFLLIPHYVVLFFLWVAFAVVTVAAFVAILVTGRYPASLFGFNLGVLRWSWRVNYYGYSALGTDRYPPFSLGAEPDYPATLEIARPERLSRGLVLVKWWLLAIPHYLVLAVLLGGAATATTTTTGNGVTWTTVTSAGTGLISLLVCFAAVALLFTARYPAGLFAFVLGLDRWVLRVVTYVALMTDAYPPFRLDQGGDEPAPPPPAPVPGRPGATAVEPPVPAAWGAASARGPSSPSGTGSAGPVIALVAGLVALLIGLGVAAGGAGALWLSSRRDDAGFVSTTPVVLTTPTSALTAENAAIHLGEGAEAWVPSSSFGTIRIGAASTDGRPVFIGIAPQSAVDGWLAGVARDEVRNVGLGGVRYVRHDGAALLAPPADQTFWVASVAGPGQQELRWTVGSGEWAVVLARPDGSAGVAARVDVAASIPDLRGLGIGLLLGGLVVVAGGVALVVVGAAGLGRRTGTTPPPGPPLPQQQQPQWTGPGPGTAPQEPAAPVGEQR